jgi:CheY-like chemotaxis protein
MPDPRMVLVVDDDADTRDLLCHLLNGHGYRAIGCGNGREALELLETGANPGIVLLDLMMPIMGGERFVEALRSHTEFAGTSIVVLTGDDSAPGRLGHHGVEVLLKPSEPQLLVATLHRHASAG